MPKAETTDGAHRTVKPSEELAAIVGDTPMPRTEVTSKLWSYIKAHDLQNPDDRREIIADGPLEKVLGTKRTDMFSMTKLVSKHLS